MRPLRPGDLPLLAGWLAQPHVGPWWQEPADLPSVTERYTPMATGAEAVRGWILTVDGVEAGFGQAYPIAEEPEWQASLSDVWPSGDGIGIDYLIGDPTRVHMGLGPSFVQALVGVATAAWPSERHVVVTVTAANRASWRTLELAGFTRRWSGEIASDDPSDAGEQYLYVRELRGGGPAQGSGIPSGGPGTAA